MVMKAVLSLRQAVLATITYFDILDFPLTIAEISEYLYGWSAPEEAVAEEVAQMPEISHLHGFHFLQGREEIAEMRKERAVQNAFLWKRVQRWRWLFSLCPFVKLVAVCNTVAYGNGTEKSDIDLFVITKNGKMATARFFMKLFTHIFGVRAHHDKVAARFCLSFFVTEKTADLAPIAHEFDPHLAYFVLTMKPIYGEKTYLRFLKINEQWAAPYFKRPLSPNLRHIKVAPFLLPLRWILESVLRILSGVLEPLLYELQSKRDLAHKKRAVRHDGIILRKDLFKFHEHDTRQEIAEEFARRLEI